jgi:AcrR family transcriptional regulator
MFRLSNPDLRTAAMTPDTATDPAAPRAMRSDAVRNRSRILEAAESVFAAEGVSVPIDRVAERAGVGVGTLYRHFPTKEALFEAIVMTRVDELVGAARARASADDPGEALFACLRHLAGEATAKQDLFDAMSSAGIDIKSRTTARMGELTSAIDVLVTRAKAAGTVRSDVATAEIMGLVVGACKSSGHGAREGDSAQRMVEIVCAGIRA